MTRDGLWTLASVLAATAAICCALQAKKAWGQSGNHGDGHAQMHDKYRGWHPPNNPHSSCCNEQTEGGEGDCRPTRAFVDDDGQWQAWDGTKWLLVPWSRVLPPDFAGDGRSHICERLGMIYCFTPAPPRS